MDKPLMGMDINERDDPKVHDEPRGEDAQPTFAQELAKLLNKYSIENDSGTPDFILAEYIRVTLWAFSTAMAQREAWYGREQDERFGTPVNSTKILEIKGGRNV
jgi:hypothetical protein